MVPEESVIERVRENLSSRTAILAFRVFFVLVTFVLVIGAIKSVLVISRFDVKFGTLFWFVNVFLIASFAVAVVSIYLMSRNWHWAVWIWACVVLGIALIGKAIGLNTAFLYRWDVALPWVVLLISAVLKTQFAKPWQRNP